MARGRPEAFSAREMPDVVYHYTTAAGLLGILRTHSLYASSADSMNDYPEGKHVLDQLQKALPNMRHRLPVDVSALDAQAVQLQREPHGYVFSASTKNDDLSQWRHYGTSGFAIGLHTDMPLGVWPRGDGKPAVGEPLEWHDVQYLGRVSL